MNKIITASEANRQFSKVLREVRKGSSVTVTSHGEPVARVVPIEHGEAAANEKAWRALLKRLRQQPAMNAGPWTRDELYDDDPE